MVAVARGKREIGPFPQGGNMLGQVTGVADVVLFRAGRRIVGIAPEGREVRLVGYARVVDCVAFGNRVDGLGVFLAVEGVGIMLATASREEGVALVVRVFLLGGVAGEELIKVILVSGVALDGGHDVVGFEGEGPGEGRVLLDRLTSEGFQVHVALDGGEDGDLGLCQARGEVELRRAIGVTGPAVVWLRGRRGIVNSGCHEASTEARKPHTRGGQTGLQLCTGMIQSKSEGTACHVSSGPRSTSVQTKLLSPLLPSSVCFQARVISLLGILLVFISPGPRDLKRNVVDVLNFQTPSISGRGPVEAEDVAGKPYGDVEVTRLGNDIMDVLMKFERVCTLFKFDVHEPEQR